VVTIPTSAAYRSLNVAQAVLVCVYELFVAAIDGPVIPAPPRATSQQAEFMYARLEDGLRAIGFLHDGNARHMMETVRGVLAHARLDDHGVQVLLGIARQMAWAGAQRGATAAGVST
jgi:tRNA/rRNA methyltransferase